MTTNIDSIGDHPLQTSCWANFRKSWGNAVVFFEKGLLTLHKLPGTSYKIGIFEKGPKPTQKMLTQLISLGKEHNLIFIKLEPSYAPKDYEQKKLIDLFNKNGAVKGKTLFTPSTFWIDLQKSEEELLTSFSSKTRYNIRYAQRKGVVVVNDNSDKAFEEYIRLMRETVNRQRFYAHSEKYHRLMWSHLHTIPVANGQKPIAQLMLAKYGTEVLAAWILFIWKDFLYYPYGASTQKQKNLQTNSALMWEAIKFGKRNGLVTFDLWGREEGKGFTVFKEGFSPTVIQFLGAWDLVLNTKMYQLYRGAEILRWPILRLKSKIFKSNF